jgi:hypothetical protein
MRNAARRAARARPPGSVERRAVCDPPPLRSVFCFNPSRLSFGRVEGNDPDLPDAILANRPRKWSIRAAYVLTDTRGRIVTGLRSVRPGVFRGDLRRASGERGLLIVRDRSSTEKREIEVFHFPTVNPSPTRAHLSRLVKNLSRW